VVVDDATRPLLAFQTSFGRFEFTRTPFGAKGAPLHFQEVMSRLLAPMGQSARVYQDDILLAAHSCEELIRLVARFLAICRRVHLRLHPEKCEFAVNETVYLGFLVNSQGYRADPARLQPVLDMRAPTNLAELRSYLGCVNWLSRFIRSFAILAAPLHALLRKEQRWHWDQAEAASFAAIFYFYL